MSTAYMLLMKKYEEIKQMHMINALLEWDSDTFMPSGASEQRAKVCGLADVLCHRMETDIEIGRLICQSKELPNLTPIQIRNIVLIEKTYEEEAKLPEDFARALSEHVVRSKSSWQKAKQTNDFSLFATDLDRMIELKKQEAAYLNPDKDPYDVLLDHFEEGVTANQIRILFSELRDGLVPMVKKYRSNKDFPFMRESLDIEIQREIAREIYTRVGLSFERGRIDETEHPFMCGEYDDIRIATHYYENKPIDGIYAMLHECGHALYETNIPSELRWTPVGNAGSFGLHESQSRFLENIIGRSRNFVSYLYFWLDVTTSILYDSTMIDDLYHAINVVCPSKIRVEADEVTYSLHIILRFELENMIFHDKVTVKELPQVWNEMMDEYLGVKVEKDSEGVLQDVHWSSGIFGYFPSYALGNIFDGMFLDCLNDNNYMWDAGLASGIVTEPMNWMKKNVHALGNLYPAFDAVKKITGKEVATEPYLRYLRNKCEEL